MKKHVCAQCGHRLGLGVRFLNYFQDTAWVHKRFCSNYCADLFDQAQRVATQRARRWFTFLQPHSAD